MNKDHTPESSSRKTKGNFVCPNCGSRNIQTSQKQYCFPYGVEENQVELSTEVPVRICAGCGFEFLDYVGQNVCHEAVCRYLGVMTPSQIKGLRKLYNLTQAQFREITKLGEATLSRWERGLVIQNQAYDNYLYLLGFPKNLDRIRSRDKSGEVSQLNVDDDQGPEHQEGIMLRNIPPGSPSFHCVKLAS